MRIPLRIFLLGMACAVSLFAASPPVFVGSASMTSLHLGDAAIFVSGAVGDQPIAYQWFKDGVPIAGATTGTFSIPYARHADAGVYTLMATNAAGTATSPPITVRIITVAPTITRHPSSVTVFEGQSVNFIMAATGSPDPTYQWFHDGVAVPGATGTNFPIGNAARSDAGLYTCTATNEAGSATTVAAELTVNRAARIVNLSSRIAAETGKASLTTGFVIESRGAMQALVRAIGPTLGNFGLAAVADPALQVDAPWGVVATNDDWQAGHAPVFAAAGAFALNPASKDAAVVAMMGNGAFTATARDKDNRAGALMLEVYDASGPESAGAFINASTLGPLAPGAAIVSGFVVTGVGNITMLLRAVGPQLRPFGVADAATAAQLELYSGGTRIATNAGWSTAANAAQLAGAMANAGAFALPTGSNDAAILISVPAGNYTVETTNRGTTAGKVLFELYLVR